MKKGADSESSSVSRRQVLAWSAAGAATLVSGCCSLRGFQNPSIPWPGDPADAAKSAAFLAPRSINTKGVPETQCIDVHAHIFNASDVTIKGYLEGPVANSFDPRLQPLVTLLAPIADWLGERAPAANKEYRDLLELSREMHSESLDKYLDDTLERERQELSRDFFEELIKHPKGRRFRAEYESLLRDTKPGKLGKGETSLNEASVFEAMTVAEIPRSDEELIALGEKRDGPYPEGVLAFVGYMLSSRWANLRSYQRAFCEGDSSIGVCQTVASLVDFDRWLDCAPRSAREDQVVLHALISRLSKGYVQPLVPYNPWTDLEERDAGLELVKTALDHGFAGVKIYPPNGFRPYGNSGRTMGRGEPSGRALDSVLKRFWAECAKRGAPVMAHAGPSMGKTNDYSALTGPQEWQRLLDADFWSEESAPRIVLGHFGGEAAGNDNLGADWPARFTRQMNSRRGRNLYADLGYWDELRCDAESPSECPSVQRLLQVLDLPVYGGGTAADRLMFGSDWLMLSKERNWASYPTWVAKTLRSWAPQHLAKIFGENAKDCYGARLRLS